MDLHDETNQLKDISTWCAIKEQQLLLLFYMKTSLCMCIMYFKKKREYTQEPQEFSYCHVRQLFLSLEILTTGFDLQFLDVTKKVGIMIF